LLHDEDDLLKEMSARANMPFVRGHSQWEVLIAPLKHYYGPHTLSTLKMSYANLKDPYPAEDTEQDNGDEYVTGPDPDSADDEPRSTEWTAVVIRLHHALGDGRSLVGLMVSVLTDNTFPDRLSDTPASQMATRPWSGRRSRLVHLLWSLTQLPCVVWRLLKRGDASLLHGPRLEGDKHLVW
ncbi:unnamed protein product, partial [Meganyctiphanes norvegica]